MTLKTGTQSLIDELQWTSQEDGHSPFRTSSVSWYIPDTFV